MGGDAAVAGYSFDCFLVFTVLVHVDCYLFRLVASRKRLCFAFFDEGVDRVDFTLLVQQTLCQLLSLLLVLGLIFLVLFYHLFVLFDGNDVLFLEKVEFSQQAGVVFFELTNLGLELLVSESCWFDVFVHYPLYFYNLLHDFLHLNRSLNVNWLDLHLPLDLLRQLQFLSKRFYFLRKLIDSPSALRMHLIHLISLLSGPQQLSLSFLLYLLQSALQLFYLLIFGSERILQFLHLRDDDLILLLKLLDLVLQVLVFCLFLLQLALILLSDPLP